MKIFVLFVYNDHRHSDKSLHTHGCMCTHTYTSTHAGPHLHTHTRAQTHGYVCVQPVPTCSHAPVFTGVASGRINKHQTLYSKKITDQIFQLIS